MFSFPDIQGLFPNLSLNYVPALWDWPLCRVIYTAIFFSLFPRHTRTRDFSLIFQGIIFRPVWDWVILFLVKYTAIFLVFLTYMKCFPNLSLNYVQALRDWVILFLVKYTATFFSFRDEHGIFP